MSPITSDSRRVALVTGASGAIGLAIARQLASKPDWEVVLVCRDARKGERCVAQLQRETRNRAVRCELADLSRHSSILALARRWDGPLSVLVNNAATTPRRRQCTPEGIELQFATNVLGYFWMMMAFADQLQHSAL